MLCELKMLHVTLIHFPVLLCGPRRRGAGGGAEWREVELQRCQPLSIPHSSLQPPAEDKINGILLGFRIRYRELLYEGLRGFTLRGINNPGAKWAELTCE